MQTVIIPNHKKIIQVPNELRPALCLDLDGTVRYSKNGRFINKPDDVALFAGVEEAIWKYRDKGYLIFGITNQGGVAYGIKSVADHQAELDATFALFERNPFHGVKACFHHDEGRVEPFCHRSLLRKPSIGMLALLEIDAWEAGFIVDWEKSVFVGDREEDKQCVYNAGVYFIWADEFFDRKPTEQVDDG